MIVELINRSAVIVKPKQSFLEWTKLDDKEGLAESVFNSLRKEPHVYLLPEYVDDTTQREVLEDYWAALFESMLAGWLRDPSGWPKRRTFQMFQEWFEIQMTSMVDDLDLDEPLEHQE